MSNPMGKLWRAFADLLPRELIQIGTVTSVAGDRYNVTLDGGGVLQCTAGKTWTVGSRVQCVGQRIDSEAADLTTVTYEI